MHVIDLGLSQGTALAALAAAALMTETDVCAATVRYRAMVLPQLNGGPLSEALAINSDGAVAGSAGSGAVNPGQHGVVWSDDQIRNLDTMFSISTAQVINDAGLVAGVGAFCPPMSGPCSGVIARALPGGTLAPVGTLGGGNGEVLDINADGMFVGWWYDSVFNQRAFVYTEAEGVRDLGVLTGFAGSGSANALNDAGEVVGVIRNEHFEQRAFHWRDGEMTDLGTLGGDASEATDVNSAGVVVGWGRRADGLPRAFRIMPGGVMEELTTPPGAVWSSANLVNDTGLIAGTWHDGKEDRMFVHAADGGVVDIGEPLEDFHPFAGPRDLNSAGRMIGVGITNMYQPAAWLWSPESGIRMLNDLVVAGDSIDIQWASAINEAGQIVVTGVMPGTFLQRAARLDPVAPADLNADMLVNIDDLLALIARWGSDDVIADIDGDGIVDIDDLLSLIAAWS